MPTLPEQAGGVSEKRFQNGKIMRSNLISKRVLSPIKATPRANSGIKAIDMSKLSPRHPDSIRIGFPNPSESRFESLKGNIELMSKFKNTKVALDFDSSTKRGEVWGKPKP